MNNKTVITLTCFLTVSTPGLADITTDGTVGPKGQLSGPNYHIGQDLGSLRGNNLFHSFGRFNLNRSESATFTGDSHIKNVISRVTGGSLSTIDGTLKSAIGRAAFYFINPAGIVFGQNAHVDVPGAFYASTAGELKFADGTKFSALSPQGNTLSMAAPEAFGFLGKQTGTMAVNGADLVFKPGASVHLSAGKVTMANASLIGEAMNLQLVSTGNSAQVVGVKSLPSQALPGDLSITNTLLATFGNGKGRIAVRAGDVEAAKSQIISNNIGNQDMSASQGIDIKTENLTLNDAVLFSIVDAAGNAGAIKVNVNKTLKMLKGGAAISAIRPGREGDTGDIIVKASDFKIDAGATTKPTGILSIALLGSSGKIGRIDVKAQNNLVIVSGGQISSSVEGKGNAKQMSVEAGNILIDKEKSTGDTGIFTFSRSIGNLAKAGDLRVKVIKGLVINNGKIASITSGPSNAGSVVVQARDIRIDGGKTEDASGIGSIAGPGQTGDAGKVEVKAQNKLTLLNTALISTSTFGKGNAGKVTVHAGTIVIENFVKSDSLTGISSAVELDNATGNPGTVNVVATKAISINSGGISIKSGKSSGNTEKANETKITITTPRFILINNSKISAEAAGSLPASPIEINASQLRMENSTITTAAAQNDGGPITINANDWALFKNSQITTSVGSDKQSFSGLIMGNGGDITINADVLVLDSGFIQANTNRKNASGGDINLNVKQLVASGGNLQSGGNKRLNFNSNSGFNVIQAAAPNGINGRITNTAPQLNIVGALAGLNTPQLDLNRVGRDPCSSIVQQSTMKKLGKGGIPYFNKGQDGYTIDRLLPKRKDRASQTVDLAKALPDNGDCQSIDSAL